MKYRELTTIIDIAEALKNNGIVEISIKGMTSPVWKVISPNEQKFNLKDWMYRAAPKPKYWWVNVYTTGSTGNLHDTKQDAQTHSVDPQYVKTIKLMEVEDK